MNLSVLERMVVEGDLSRDAFMYLLNCRGECEWLDYKIDLQLEDDYALCAFAKDVLAFKNVGGGYLLVGVQDKTWAQLGVEGSFQYDTKLLRDKVQRATGITLDIDVVVHELSDGEKTRQFPLVLVRSSKKRSKRRKPTLASKDFCIGKPFGIRRGEIYVRRGDSTVRISDGDELADLLDRLEGQSDVDHLQSGETASPFAVVDGTYRLLDQGYSSFIGRDTFRESVLQAICGDPRIWITNVHGPGGVGKSALVNWATYELYEKREFEAILQLTAKETVLTTSGIKRHGRSLYSLDNLLEHILLMFEENVSNDLGANKRTAYELLEAWKTLLVLDNMETVSDGRILGFVQGIPVGSQSKVVLTSRQRSDGWELPIPVTELTGGEMLDFVRLKAREYGVDVPTDAATMRMITEVSGGLPLAAQWIIGQYRKTKNLANVFKSLKSKDSPVLEFSFRNIWNSLEGRSKTVLALMSVIDGPVTVQDLVVASEMSADAVSEALADLMAVTLVNRVTQQSDGRTIYTALPITLSFAKNELGGMGDLEIRARQRLRRIANQMELQDYEVARFRGEFERYGLTTANEKKAGILCRRAESEMFSGNADTAKLLFDQAKALAPQAAYVYAKYAAYELAARHSGRALDLVNEACRRANKKTGGLCYRILARIHDVEHNKVERVAALAKALEYDSEDTVLRHQFGVALSRAGRTGEAVAQFTAIINEESKVVPPRETLVMALTTRIINYIRLNNLEKAREDWKTADDLIAAHSYLGRAAERLADLKSEIERTN